MIKVDKKRTVLKGSFVDIMTETTLLLRRVREIIMKEEGDEDLRKFLWDSMIALACAEDEKDADRIAKDLTLNFVKSELEKMEDESEDK